ncbi:hypothetical protein IMZ48_12085 [Candidatus Bathyarchaeota archaeon]|nr:hypothetical protein [Candidatus Bathyarchaeota archaeon]
MPGRMYRPTNTMSEMDKHMERAHLTGYGGRPASRGSSDPGRIPPAGLRPLRQTGTSASSTGAVYDDHGRSVRDGLRAMVGDNFEN